MTAPDLPALLAALEATWPAAAQHRLGHWVLREGRGGGKRVSSATAEAPVTEADIDLAETKMRAVGQGPLFQLRPAAFAWDVELDALLAARGYGRLDPTLFYTAPVGRLLAETPPAMAAFPIWPPLAIQRDIWAAAGVGPARVAVMERAAGPRVALMARQSDRVAGSVFGACHGTIAMLHAMEITPALRRRGAARNVTRAAAVWAAEQGAEWLALAVTEANAPARALYAALGMAPAGGYHYREHPQETAP